MLTLNLKIKNQKIPINIHNTFWSLGSSLSCFTIKHLCPEWSKFNHHIRIIKVSTNMLGDFSQWIVPAPTRQVPLCEIPIVIKKCCHGNRNHVPQLAAQDSNMFEFKQHGPVTCLGPKQGKAHTRCKHYMYSWLAVGTGHKIGTNCLACPPFIVNWMSWTCHSVDFPDKRFPII